MPGQARIVSLGAGYVVVDKPAGVPVVYSTDNVVESCLTCVAQARARRPDLPGDRNFLGASLTQTVPGPRQAYLDVHGLRPGIAPWRCLSACARGARLQDTQHADPGVGSEAVTAEAQALGEEEPLRPTHRLDTCTSGLAVLGRTPAFVAAFNRLLAAKGAARPLRKLYRALSAAEPPVGARPVALARRSLQSADVAWMRIHSAVIAFGLDSCPSLPPQVPALLPDARAWAQQERWCTMRR